MATTRVERRLVAILAADVVGYSTLMEQDEDRTLALLEAHRRECIEPLIAEYHGRVVKLMGDGLLCEFASIVDGVQCAIAIQRGMGSRETDVPEGERIRFRIGVNLGDVIREKDGDLYGEGVNIAARLEGLAEPGGIVISGTAYDHLQGKLDCNLASLGERPLKNIERPVRTYRVELHSASGKASAQPTVRPASATPSIAVLPFINLSGDPAQGYFSDGITEDIITELSRFRPLAVIARTSSFQFHGKAMPVQEIGRALNAAFIVEGSVRRLGEQLRITAQLIEAATGRHLWADRYDRDMTELFALQDEVVRNVVYTVATRLSEEIRETSRRKLPEDLGAYDCFLRGNHLMDGTPAEQAEAVTLFERARTLDPGFARACTGLVWAKMMQSFAPMPKAAAVVFLDEALLLAEQALGLDPGDGRVHFSAGWVYLFRQDFSRARPHFDRALALNPNDPTILITWAWACACMGEPNAAFAAMQAAMRLDPWIHWYPARIEFLARRYAQALAHLDAATGTGPRWSAWRAATLAHLGKVDEARATATEFIEATAARWQGDQSVGPGDYCAWILDSTPLRLTTDREHLREGMRLAGLPA